MDYRVIRRPPMDADANTQKMYRIGIASDLTDMDVDYGEEWIAMPMASFKELTSAAPETPKVRSSDPGTSRLAALKNEPKRGSQRHKVIELLVKEWEAGREGATASDIAELTGIPLNSISTRMSECERGGWVRVLKTVEQDGSDRSMYEATEKARNAYADPVAL